MENILTKKNVFLGSLLGSLMAGTRGLSLWCSPSDWECRDKNDSLSLFFLMFVPVFFFSLVTYKMRAGVFGAWRNFAVVWLPISILLVAISPGTSADFQIIDKEFVAIVLSLLFTLISLILITYKSFALRKKG